MTGTSGTVLESRRASDSFFEGIPANKGPAALQDLVRRMVLVEAVTALADAGIPVMPLKGAYLAYWVYDSPTDRQVSDVDLLVPRSSFSQALELLSARGYRPEPPHSPSERCLRAKGVPLPIDLHWDLFPYGQHRLKGEDLLARGTPDRRTLGVPVIVPDPLDAFAHVTAHAATQKLRVTETRTRRDLEVLVERFSLDPSRCATHLRRVGLRRAARVTFTNLVLRGEFESEVVARLGHDPVGAFVAAISRAMGARCEPDTRVAWAIRFLLGNSLLTVPRALLRAIQCRFAASSDPDRP